MTIVTWPLPAVLAPFCLLKRLLIALALIWFGLTPESFAEPTEYDLSREGSLFAVVTHSGGLFSPFGHDHLVSAGDYRAILDVHRDNLASTRLAMTIPARSLLINDPDVVEKLTPVLRDLDIVDRDFPHLSKGELDELRDNMLSDRQLDAEHYPEITARLVRVLTQQMDFGGQQFDQQVIVEVALRGRTVRRLLAANIELSDSRLEAIAVGVFRFTDFDIEPFSAFFGLLRVENQFHVVVTMKAEEVSTQVEASPDSVTLTYTEAGKGPGHSLAPDPVVKNQREATGGSASRSRRLFALRTDRRLPRRCRRSRFRRRLARPRLR